MRAITFLSACLLLGACANPPRMPLRNDACTHPAPGCGCEPGAPPIACFEKDEVLGEGQAICHEGTSYCRDGRYGACEDVHAYPAPTRGPSALVNPKSTPENCSICNITCFKVKDPLLADAAAPGSLSYGPGGGVTLTPIDAGVADASAPDAGDGGVPASGCGALKACCDTLYAQPSVGAACQATVDAADDATCDAERGLYCPSVISGPIAGCTAGSSAIDSDCDGIPDGFDQCTAATAATDPACMGRVMPLPTSANQTIFHVLGKGQSASNALEIGYKVQNADVYFLMDMTDTMSDERDALVGSLIGGDLVDCALLKSCCNTLASTDPKKAKCDQVVSDDDQANCRNKGPSYCSNPRLLDCPDLDFDGAPDNDLKSEGVIGAVRCLVGSSWFGAGFFRDIPFRDGVFYIGFDGDDTKGIQDRGNRDEQAFRHWIDMTPDWTRIDAALMNFSTAANYDYPEADLVALYSLATGKGHMFGNASPSVPERAGAGCSAGAFGYPCFRPTAIPIVVLFTDDPLSNGPPGWSAGGREKYDATYTLNGKAPGAGVARFTPVSAENFPNAYELGDVTKKFVIASGNTRDMVGDYTELTTGCFASTPAPDVAYRFELSANDNVPFTINVTQDPLGYNDSFTPPNLPTPATEFPLIMSVYKGDPTSGGSLLQCQRICPDVAPFNSCLPLGDTCSSNGQCCSSKCSSKKCSGSDPAGTRACFAAERASNGFTLNALTAGTYYMTIKGRRLADRGFFEVQVGDPKNGSSATKYTPPSWAQTRDALTAAGIKVLPVLSCSPGSNGGRCDGAAKQLKALAQATGAIDKNNGGAGLLTYIDPDGSGLGSKLAMAVRDLANYLAMDITLGVTGNPGFDIQIQKCTNKLDSGQAAVCTNFATGCKDPSPVPLNTIAACDPGALPVFVVSFRNPPDPNSVPKNPSDPYGGYHFSLQLVGNHQHLLEEIPVYIIPADSVGPPPPPPPPVSYASSGSYQQDVYGGGCSYYLAEGEAWTGNACGDGKDNDGDGKVDTDDPDCMPGSCLDGKDNDGDGLSDLEDLNCVSTERQDWSELYYKADVPFGTSIDFEVCTGNDAAELASCSFAQVAHVSSASGGCGTNRECAMVPDGSGGYREGFCGYGGQCQFIDPMKLGAMCTADVDCPNETVDGIPVSARCDSLSGRCLYRSPPIEVAARLPENQNGKPYARVRITLHASLDKHATPTVSEWYLQYVCRTGL